MTVPLPHVPQPPRVTDRGNDPSVRRSDLAAWGRVTVTVFPLLTGIIVATWVLSQDAGSIKRDVSALQVTVARHAQILESQADVMPAIERVSRQVKELGERVATMGLDTSANAARSSLFWSTIWPDAAERLKRIENKLDRGR